MRIPEVLFSLYKFIRGMITKKRKARNADHITSVLLGLSINQTIPDTFCLYKQSMSHRFIQLINPTVFN